MDYLRSLIDRLRGETYCSVCETEGGLELTFDQSYYSHFWSLDSRWFFGFSERGEDRSRQLESGDERMVVNWALYQWANEFRHRRDWPLIRLPKEQVAICPGWSVVGSKNALSGVLVDPAGKVLDMWMRSVGPRYTELVELSWIVDADTGQLFDSLTNEDGAPLLEDFLEGESRA